MPVSLPLSHFPVDGHLTSTWAGCPHATSRNATVVACVCHSVCRDQPFAACCLCGCLQTPEEERKRLLSFVVCGGGPTGVEVAAEMHDMIFDDLKVRPFRHLGSSLLQ